MYMYMICQAYLILCIGSIFDQDPVAKPKKKVVKKAGSAKKSTKQQAASIFDDDAPSIFDDPSAGAK